MIELLRDEAAQTQNPYAILIPYYQGSFMWLGFFIHVVPIEYQSKMYREYSNDSSENKNNLLHFYRISGLIELILSGKAKLSMASCCLYIMPVLMAGLCCLSMEFIIVWGFWMGVLLPSYNLEVFCISSGPRNFKYFYSNFLTNIMLEISGKGYILNSRYGGVS